VSSYGEFRDIGFTDEALRATTPGTAAASCAT
jgi:hypothetical protein